MHWSVAGLPAKCDRVGKLVGLICSDSTCEQYSDDGKDRQHRQFSVLRIIEVDSRIRWYLDSGRLASSSPFQQHSDWYEQEAKNYYAWQDQVKDAHIGPGSLSGQVCNKNECKVEGAYAGKRRSRHTKPVAKQAWLSITHFGLL